MKSFLLSALVAAVAAQQPEMASIHVTGNVGELSIDFVTHDATQNCTGGGVQYGTTPNKLQFVPAYDCEDFTAQEMSASVAGGMARCGVDSSTQSRVLILLRCAAYILASRAFEESLPWYYILLRDRH